VNILYHGGHVIPAGNALESTDIGERSRMPAGSVENKGDPRKRYHRVVARDRSEILNDVMCCDVMRCEA
jgi:hypothetical protein